MTVTTAEREPDLTMRSALLIEKERILGELHEYDIGDDPFFIETMDVLLDNMITTAENYELVAPPTSIVEIAPLDTIRGMLREELDVLRKPHSVITVRAKKGTRKMKTTKTPKRRNILKFTARKK